MVIAERTADQIIAAIAVFGFGEDMVQKIGPAFVTGFVMALDFHVANPTWAAAFAQQNYGEKQHETGYLDGLRRITAAIPLSVPTEKE